MPDTFHLDRDDIDLLVERNVPYFTRFTKLWEDWTGSTFKAEMRTRRDITGLPPLLDFTPGIVLDYAGSATIAVHLAAGRVGTWIYQLTNPGTGHPYVDADVVPLSWLRVSLDVPSILLVPYPEERGFQPGIAYYDVIRNPSGSGAVQAMRGRIIARPSVTIP
jgi:hypothetical protein